MNDDERVKRSSEALKILAEHAAYAPAFMGEATIAAVRGESHTVTLSDVLMLPAGDDGFFEGDEVNLSQYLGKRIKIVVQVEPEGGFRSQIRDLT